MLTLLTILSAGCKPKEGDTKHICNNLQKVCHNVIFVGVAGSNPSKGCSVQYVCTSTTELIFDNVFWQYKNKGARDD